MGSHAASMTLAQADARQQPAILAYCLAMTKADRINVLRRAEEAQDKAAELVTRSRELQQKLRLNEGTLQRTEKLTEQLHDKIRNVRQRKKR
jgi:hypothetical protein